MFNWKQELSAKRDELITLRREFHAYPELSLREFRTARRIEEELNRLNIPHSRVGETGVLGILRGTGTGSGTVALRSDIDALPIQETNPVNYRSQTDGIMHACGHDAHIACLLGAAQLLAAHRGDFGGEVRLIFQPAEEIGAGAKQFISVNALEGVDRVFGLHTAYDLPAGTVGLKPGLNNAAVDHFKITVHGKAAHVSTPQKGVDALYIASQTVVSLQALVTRRISPLEPVIIGVGKLNAGTTYNALAERAELEGTTRTTSLEMREQVRSWVTETTQRTAELYGGTADIVWTDFAAPLFNDSTACQEAAKVAEYLDAPVTLNRALSLSGDDFAEFLLKTPGVYAYLGTGNIEKPQTLNSNHNGNFDIDEETLTLGAGLYAGYALLTLKGKLTQCQNHIHDQYQ